MKSRTLNQLTGILLILTPLAFITTFSLLQMNFEYPDILRKPTEYVLQQFSAGGAGLLAMWYALMFSAVLFVPLAVLLHSMLARQDTPYLAVGTTFGVIAGVVQFLGLIRWTFLVPYLAQTYLAPTASPATRDAVAVVFQAFNQYAGAGIGEHLGYLFTSVWTLFVGIAMLKSPVFRAWLGWLGILAAIGIFVGVFEPVGFAAAGAINATAYIVWAVWLIVVGVFALRAKPM